MPGPCGSSHSFTHIVILLLVSTGIFIVFGFCLTKEIETGLIQEKGSDKHNRQFQAKLNLAFYSKKRESNNELNTLIHKHSDVFTNIQQRKIIVILALAAVSSLMYNTTLTPSFAQVNNTQGNSSGNANVSTPADNETSTQDYILNIRSLLNQTLSAYADNDNVKASELATTAYLDNFEHIEEPIGEELSEQGEELLREQLRAQIDSNASIDDIRQTVNAINTVLDEAEKSLTS